MLIQDRNKISTLISHDIHGGIKYALAHWGTHTNDCVIFLRTGRRTRSIQHEQSTIGVSTSQGARFSHIPGIRLTSIKNPLFFFNITYTHFKFRLFNHLKIYGFEQIIRDLTKEVLPLCIINISGIIKQLAPYWENEVCTVTYTVRRYCSHYVFDLCKYGTSMLTHIPSRYRLLHCYTIMH